MNSDGTEKKTLSAFLAAQRASVPAIVDGLDTQALTTSVLPSGWTPLGLMEHLGRAERYWFQEIVTGAAEPLPWPDEHAPLTTPRGAVSSMTCMMIANCSTDEQDLDLAEHRPMARTRDQPHCPDSPRGRCPGTWLVVSGQRRPVSPPTRRRAG
ncbi:MULTISPECIES: DUF664 domain-containing protein [unclassified Streptomyces]|uniref:mycothiol transferase n=1 Tax=unclassified Streptomyces TaxID=2593676 RepID=UPI000563E47A|nr:MULTISPECIES: DUF664 domain-containing protein [unclassified Streptomyces]